MRIIEEYPYSAQLTRYMQKRLEEEVDKLKLLSESQESFRAGKRTIDNIFVLNHLAQRERKKKDEKIYAMFVDLKAAFDSIDRERLWSILEEKKINKGLIRKIREVYEDTKVVIKTEEGLTGAFRTGKEVRQGCVMSPLLFNLYVADLDKYMEKRGIRGVKLNDERIWSLAYADDIIVLANNRVALMDMMNTLNRFLKDRKLI